MGDKTKGDHQFQIRLETPLLKKLDVYAKQTCEGNRSQALRNIMRAFFADKRVSARTVASGPDAE